MARQGLKGKVVRGKKLAARTALSAKRTARKLPKVRVEARKGAKDRRQPQMTPISRAATGVRPVQGPDERLHATDDDVLRISAAVAQHRKELMDRLAK